MDCKIEMPTKNPLYILKEMSIGEPFTFLKEAGAEVNCIVFAIGNKRQEKTVPVFGFKTNSVYNYDDNKTVYPLVQISCATYKFIETIKE